MRIAINKSLGTIIIILCLGQPACRIFGGRIQPVDEEPAQKQVSTESILLDPSPSAFPSSTSTPIPTPTKTFTPTITTIPSLTPTFTVTSPPVVRPTLQHIDVNFITHGDRERPYVALTFDLCQDPAYPAGFDQGIYQVLVETDARATFFVGGDWARTHPDEVQLVADNHLFELGNHSWSHPDLIDLSEGEIHAEVSKTQDILYKMTGRQPRLFRLPSGLFNDQVLSVIAYQGLYTIQWDVVTADPVPDNSAEKINKIVRDGVENGSIIIMHANQRGWNTAEALPEMIQYLRQQGYTLVTVSQLIGLEPMPVLE